MPSDKSRSKEETWKEAELKESLKEISRDRRHKDTDDKKRPSKRDAGEEHKGESRRKTDATDGREARHRTEDDNRKVEDRGKQRRTVGEESSHRNSKDDYEAQDKQKQPDSKNSDLNSSRKIDGQSNRLKNRGDETNADLRSNEKRQRSAERKRDDEAHDRKSHRDEDTRDHRTHRDENTHDRKSHRDKDTQDHKSHGDKGTRDRRSYRDEDTHDSKSHRDKDTQDHKSHRDEDMHDRRSHRGEDTQDRKSHRDKDTQDHKSQRDEDTRDRRSQKHQSQSEQSGDQKHRKSETRPADESYGSKAHGDDRRKHGDMDRTKDGSRHSNADDGRTQKQERFDRSHQEETLKRGSDHRKNDQKPLDDLERSHHGTTGSDHRHGEKRHRDVPEVKREYDDDDSGKHRDVNRERHNRNSVQRSDRDEGKRQNEDGEKPHQHDSDNRERRRHAEHSYEKEDGGSRDRGERSDQETRRKGREERHKRGAAEIQSEDKAQRLLNGANNEGKTNRNSEKQQHSDLSDSVSKQLQGGNRAKEGVRVAGAAVVGGDETRKDKSDHAKSVTFEAADDGSEENYEEDFEDYDEDFEDDDEEKDESDKKANQSNSITKQMSNRDMEELFDALNRENDRLLVESRKSNWSDSTDTSEERLKSTKKPTAAKPRTFINFVAAKQRDIDQKVSLKARKRCQELLQIIELDTVSFQLFDLPPMKEYDLYMSSFGRTNAQQAYVQTNDDNLEREIQTESIEFSDKWCQHPAEDSLGCGGDNNDQRTAQSSQVNERKLNDFLQRYTAVIERILEEEYAKSNYTEQKSELSFSDGSLRLKSLEIFRSRDISHLQFCLTQSSILLTMHGLPSQFVEKTIDKYGLLGVWNINDISQPQKVLACASVPTCCCFSPTKATLVFAGTKDGAVVAWDLRESPTMHHSFILDGLDWLLRFPTYNTACSLQSTNHLSPVVSILPIVSQNREFKGSAGTEAGLSFQLASIDQSAIINLWVVAEINEGDAGGSESDLGLSPNGRIKLLKSSSIVLSYPAKDNLGGAVCALHMQLNPSNRNHFYVATDVGMILHCSRFGDQKSIPRAYLPTSPTLCRVSAIDLHPFGLPVLLAGYEDGSLRLYHFNSEHPVVSWEGFSKSVPIRKVLWSRNCPYIAYVLDESSSMHLWDLLRNDAEPLKTDRGFRSRVVDFCLSDEQHSTSKPKMVLGFADGSVDIHILSSHVSNLQPGEVDQFTRFVDQF